MGERAAPPPLLFFYFFVGCFLAMGSGFGGIGFGLFLALDGLIDGLSFYNLRETK